MEALTQYLYSPKWGDPTAYDVLIHKSGEGLETRYQVTVDPKEALDEGIVTLYQDMQLDLAALYRGEDPFKPAENGQTMPKAGQRA
jgi:hypothetical protein